MIRPESRKPTGKQLETLRKTEVAPRRRELTSMHRSLHEVVKDPSHTDIVGGDPESRAAVLAQGVLPNMQRDENFSTFVIDLSGVGISEPLVAATENSGIGGVDWQVSPEKLLERFRFTPSQIAAVLAESMPTDGQQEANRNVEKRILTKLCTRLAEQQGEQIVSPSLAMIHESLEEILQIGMLSDESSVLTEEQRDRARTSFPDEFVSHNKGMFTELWAHIGTVVASDQNHTPADYNNDSQFQLLTLSVPTKGDRASQQRVLVQSMMHVVEDQTPIGKPDLLILAGAENVDTEVLKQIKNICARKGVRSAFFYEEVDEEVAKVIGREGAGLASLRISNALEAQQVSAAIGEAKIWEHSGHSENISKSDNRDSGKSYESGTWSIKSTRNNSRSRGETKTQDNSFSFGPQPIVHPSELERLAPGELLYIDNRGAVSPLHVGTALTTERLPRTVFMDPAFDEEVEPKVIDGVVRMVRKLSDRLQRKANGTSER